MISKRRLWELLTHPVETNEGGVGGKNKKDGGGEEDATNQPPSQASAGEKLFVSAAQRPRLP